jgi:type I restriction enzyme, S subunit
MFQQLSKDSYRLTEIGKVSLDWIPIRLGEVFKERDEKGFQDLELLAITSERGIIKRCELDKRDTSNPDKSNYLRVLPGDIGYNTMRMWQGVSGVSQFEGIVSPAYTVCIPSSEIDAKFMAYLFKYPPMIRIFRRFSQGLVDDTLSLKFESFSRIKTYVPLLEEQKRIAEILSTIDETIAHTQAVIDQIQVVKRGLMQQLLTKGLPGWHSDYKCVGNVEIPASWNVVNLEHCAVVQTGIAKGRKYAEGQEPIDVPYLRVANVQDGYFDLSEIKKIKVLPEEISRYLLKEGDVLLTEGGDADKLGRGHIWHSEIDGCVHQNHIFCVRPNPQILDPYFFNYLTSSTYGKTYFLNSSKQTTNLASINSAQLKQFPCLLPSLTEQTKIVRTLDAVEQRLNVERNKKRQLEITKKGLMQQLLTGKRRVPVNDGKPMGGG